ncbi:MAG: glycoside hydrolase domain-containing protein, partial [Abditibacteriaceae bacterium]
MATVARADSFDLYYQPSIIKLTTPEKGVIGAPQSFYNGWPSLRTARGEWESFQIVITAQKELLKNVHIEPQSFENPLGAPIIRDSWMIFRENYVQIPHPSARNSPPNLWWPDALIPQNLQPDISIEPGKSELFWLTVRVPQNAEAGHYIGHVEVWANGEKETVTVPLQVEPFAIPAPTMRANVAVY